MSALLTVTVGLAALVWLGFCLWYSLRARWWKSDIGVNVFGVSLSVALILTRIFFARIDPEFGDNVVVGIVLYALIGLFGLQRIYQMDRAQRYHGGFKPHA